MGNRQSLDISKNDYFYYSTNYELFNNCRSELRRDRSFRVNNKKLMPSNQNFKRINSLPLVSRWKKNKQNQNELIESHKGFDMIRHHFGQKECEFTPRLTELETSILLLNEKVSDLEASRQDCLKRLSDLKIELELQEKQQNNLFSWSNQDISSKLKHKYKKNGHLIRIQFIENYIKRLENLLCVDKEPLIVLPIKPKDNIEDNISRVKKLNDADQHPTTTAAKCQQIKQCYDYLLKNIMPQLYGKKDNSNENYHQFKKELCQIRNRIQQIPTQQEQQLIDAKRTFLCEINCYLTTLDDMMNKSDDVDHEKCLKLSI